MSMLISLKIKRGYTDKLCGIFHKALVNAEVLTGVPEFVFGEFRVGLLQAMAGRYCVWYKDTPVLFFMDMENHKFAASVLKNGYMTANMATIVIECMIKAFDAADMPNVDSSKEESISLVRSMIDNSFDKLSVSEIENMSELLYGDDNKEQLKAL